MQEDREEVHLWLRLRGTVMAEVLITFKVMPAEAEVDLEAIINGIRSVKTAKLNSLEKMPIAFGLVSLNASFVAEDEEGSADRIEKELKKIPGVGSVETVEVTRLL